jgi:hypothetical protein
MASMTLLGHQATSVEIDLCTACHVFWFDQRESLRLAPAGTLRLFSVITDATGARTAIGPVLKCPRCGSRLLHTNDRQRNTSFRYWRCPHSHGRLITFFEFLREKDFIRPLTAQQLDDLRRNMQTLNCSNCGGPIDLARESACRHCGSALSLLDVKRAGEAVAELRRASEPKAVDPALPIELARARREVDEAFAALEKSQTWWRDASSLGLVEAGLAALARWMSRPGH